MNLRELDYISAVAHHRHFGKAAKACHVSQPTLSSQILKLEAELGVTIFERIRGAVRITKQGKLLLEAAERARQATADIYALSKEFKDPFSGDFTLGVIPTIGPFLLPIFSGPLLQQHPNLKLRYIEDTTENLNELLVSGELDAAILATLPVDTTLNHLPLYDEKFYVALPVGHRLCAQDQVSLKDLEAESLLLLSEGHCLRDQTLAVCSSSQHNQAIRATSLDTLLGLVSGGYGVTLIPALSIRKNCFSDMGIIIRPIPDKKALRQVNLTYRTTYTRQQTLEGLRTLILSQYKSAR